MSDRAHRVVRVLPNVAALDRAFDYLVPPDWDGQVMVGSKVRVGLGPRRVAGWVIEDHVQPAFGMELRPLAKLSGLGPSSELVELAGWAAWRWAASRCHFLLAASPKGVVRSLPAPGAGRCQPGPGAGPEPVIDPDPAVRSLPARSSGVLGELAADALSVEKAVLRLAPTIDPVLLVVAILRRSLAPRRSVLVLAPSNAGASDLARLLSERGWPVALLPGGWAAAAAGGRVVVGSRGGAWAPCPGLAAVVVLDAHDRGYESEAAPTWVAWRVAAERTRRARASCVLVSACPTLEMLAWGRLLADSRTAERGGWAAVEIVDMRSDDPRRGLYSGRLVQMLGTATAEPGGQVVCVLNRTGRARLLACNACGELARCEHCRGPMAQPARLPLEAVPAPLMCRTCGLERPAHCVECGSTRMKVLRVGVSRVREELIALSGLAVEEVSGPAARAASEAPITPVVVGTEAVLHRLRRARSVAFLDMDQELLAPRFRAAEDALALLARASRLVGGRQAGGRVLVQTRIPDHQVLSAALHADPIRVARAESERRALLRLPPASALALVSGSGAEAYVSGLRALPVAGLEVRGPDRESWLVRAGDHQVLCDALASVPRPRGRLRIQVDPRQA